MSDRKHAVHEFYEWPSNGCVNALFIAALIWLIIFAFLVYWILKG